MNHTIHTRQDTHRPGRRIVYCSCGWVAPDTYMAHELANQAGEAHLRPPAPTEATIAANTARWPRFESD